MGNRHLSNESGMSILGVLVGASAMLVIGLAVSQMIRSQSELVYYLEDRLSVTALKSELEITLSNQNSCIRSLNSNGFRTVANSTDDRRISIVDSEGNPVFVRDRNYDKIRISDIRVQSTDAIPANGSGVVEFSILPERSRGTVSKQLAPIVVKRAVTLNNTSQVVDCSVVGTGGQDGDGIVQGRVANISGGCAPSASGPSGVGGLRGYNSLAGVAGAQTKWSEYCQTLSFPQAKAAYSVRGVTRGGDRIPIRSLASRGRVTRNDNIVSDFEIERMTGASGENNDGAQVRGPYANLWQCEHDGILPAGTGYSWSDGGGSGADGSGSGGNSGGGTCVNGAWTGN